VGIELLLRGNIARDIRVFGVKAHVS
jgi:hypothetical protein